MTKRDDKQDAHIGAALHMNTFNMMANASQAEQLAHHKKHIQVLWRHIERLEQYIKPVPEGLKIKVERSEILLRKNGTILIDGVLITLNVPRNRKMITSSGDM